MRRKFYNRIWKSRNRWKYLYISTITRVNPITVSKIAHGMELYHPQEQRILKLLKKTKVLKRLKRN